uniref:Uncharacterized protein n=1 Tax=Ananas comosus var. bracteatus TaxID=296719 RepID=A0A6V7QPZ9_ANACO|nr:unnamed protein product [Ananas comosus var. bracteatus]
MFPTSEKGSSSECSIRGSSRPSFVQRRRDAPRPAKWKGRCEFNASQCNNKLIGARAFLSGANAMKGAGVGSIRFPDRRGGPRDPHHEHDSGAGCRARKCSGMRRATPSGWRPSRTSPCTGCAAASKTAPAPTCWPAWTPPWQTEQTSYLFPSEDRLCPSMTTASRSARSGP